VCSSDLGEETVARWRKLGEALLVKYMDGNLKDELGKVQHPGYPEAWYALIAKQEGARLETKKLPTEPKGKKPFEATGFFHSREELGALGANVPKDFDFTKEKLLLVPGQDVCARPPKCCAAPKLVEGALELEAPKEEAKDPCGAPAWLFRLARDEQRKLLK
jgi:hypothetical protein